MSAVTSFALECAAAGRWARGMLALQPSLPSSDPKIKHAALSLAVAAAPHNYEAAAGLLSENYLAESGELAGQALDALARNPAVRDEAFLEVAGPLLKQAATHSAAAASELFLSATGWKGADVATALLGNLSSPPERCTERVALLKQWKREDGELYRQYFPTVLPTVGEQRRGNRQKDAKQRSVTQHYTARDHRERARLLAMRERALCEARAAKEQAAVVSAFAARPSWWSVATLLRLATRPNLSSASAVANSTEEGGTGVHVSPAGALALLGQQPLLPEMELFYIRCVGLCAPHRWEEALRRLPACETLSEERQLARLWLVSRGNPQAAAERVRALVSEAKEQAGQTKNYVLLDSRRRWGEELLSRGLLPSQTLYDLFPMPANKRPWFRLERGHSVGAIARALASGVRLDEIQLSAPVKAWAKEGQWERILAVYYRFPTAEMQRHATESMVAYVRSSRQSRGNKSAPDVRRSRHLPLPPPPESLQDVVDRLGEVASSRKRRRAAIGTHCVAVLIKASESAEEAMALLRQCVRHGATCNPQLLSAVMDKRPRPKALRRLLEHYPAAVNAGIARRAKEEFHLNVKPHATTMASGSA